MTYANGIALLAYYAMIALATFGAMERFPDIYAGFIVIPLILVIALRDK